MQLTIHFLYDALSVIGNKYKRSRIFKNAAEAYFKAIRTGTISSVETSSVDKTQTVNTDYPSHNPPFDSLTPSKNVESLLISTVNPTKKISERVTEIADTDSFDRWIR